MWTGIKPGTLCIKPEGLSALLPLRNTHLASSSRRGSVTPVRISLGASTVLAAVVPQVGAVSVLVLAAAAAAWEIAAVGGRPTTQGLGLPDVRCRDLRMTKIAGRSAGPVSLRQALHLSLRQAPRLCFISHTLDTPPSLIHPSLLPAHITPEAPHQSQGCGTCG